MRKYLYFFFIGSVFLLLFSCSKNETPELPGTTDSIPDSEDPLYQHHEEWSYNLGIYEVNIRQYTQEGTFEAFETHLPRLKEMGVGILLLMPIHPIGEENRLGSLGSYYSVKDYRDVNPEFGSMKQFKNLVEEIHDLGMFVIIDWVANHTAWDNYLTMQSPDFYNTDADGNFQAPPGTNWSDVIDLDYSNEALREYMIESMEFWIKETKIDGFRCDAVSYVPSDFWSDALTDLKAANPGILMLAEDEGVKYHNAGWDMTYVWSLMGFDNGLMRQIYEGTKNAGDMGSYLQNEINTYDTNAYRMYFTSNHDENSWHGTVFEQLGESAEVFAVLTHTMNGMPLLYSGQENGLNKRLAFFDRDPIEWTSHPFEDLYTVLLKLKKDNKALWNGEAGGRPQRVFSSDNEKVFAYLREKDGDKILAILNLSPDELSFNLKGSYFADSYSNVFTHAEIEMNTGQELTLSAWDYLVLEKNEE